MNELTAPWFTNLTEDCLDIKVETETTSRWSLTEGRHLIGLRILEDVGNFERSNIYGDKIVQSVATSIKMATRTVRYSIKLATLYPDLNMLPAGKNMSWSHIVNKYLTAGEVKPTRISPTEQIRQIKQLLQHEWMTANQGTFQNGVRVDIDQDDLKCEFIRYLQDQVEKITGG